MRYLRYEVFKGNLAILLVSVLATEKTEGRIE